MSSTNDPTPNNDPSEPSLSAILSSFTLTPTEIQTLAFPPFISIDGVANVRDIGGYISNFVSPTITSSQYKVKLNTIFRAAELSHITPAGKAQLQALGIKKLFDLRTDAEIKKYKVLPPSIDGVDVVRVPVIEREAFELGNIERVLHKFEKDELNTFIYQYSTILQKLGPSCDTIFKHIRDKPEDKCVIHCTAGKDRTGLVIAILLLLLSVPIPTIAEEYALTSVGLKPAFPYLTKRFQSDPVYRDNWKGVTAMSTSRPETMIAVLNNLIETYGSIEEYLKKVTSLNDGDFEVIRKNLIVQAYQGPRNAQL